MSKLPSELDTVPAPDSDSGVGSFPGSSGDDSASSGAASAANSSEGGTPPSSDGGSPVNIDTLSNSEAKHELLSRSVEARSEERFFDNVRHLLQTSQLDQFRDLIIKSEGFSPVMQIANEDSVTDYSLLRFVMDVCYECAIDDGTTRKVLNILKNRFIADISIKADFVSLDWFEYDLIGELVNGYSNKDLLGFLKHVDTFCKNEQRKINIFSALVEAKIRNTLQSTDYYGVDILLEIKGKYPELFDVQMINFVGGLLSSLYSHVDSTREPPFFSALLDPNFYHLFAENDNNLKLTIVGQLIDADPKQLCGIIAKFPRDFSTIDFGREGIDLAWYALLKDASEVLSALDQSGVLDVDKRYMKQVNLLHVAAIKSIKCLEYLVEKYPDLLSQADESGNYPVKVSFLKNNLDSFEILFDASSQEVKDQIRYTPRQCYNIALTTGNFDVCKFLFERNYPNIFDNPDEITPLELVFQYDLSLIQDQDVLQRIQEFNGFVVNHCFEFLEKAAEDEKRAIIKTIDQRDGSVLVNMLENDLFEDFARFVGLGFDINKKVAGDKTVADFLVEKFQELEGQEGRDGDFLVLEKCIAGLTFRRDLPADRKIKLSGGVETSCGEVMKKRLFLEMKDPELSNNFPSWIQVEGNIVQKIMDRQRFGPSKVNRRSGSAAKDPVAELRAGTAVKKPQADELRERDRGASRALSVSLISMMMLL